MGGLTTTPSDNRIKDTLTLYLSGTVFPFGDRRGSRGVGLSHWDACREEVMEGPRQLLYN